ncbi:hypothetical protein BRAS3843_740048 [Bradyrhizobium sp. STM 3843]|nr:hypothetical protein BRAS3843_740048 [Bradyrhizobium sp. STM 3843]
MRCKCGARVKARVRPVEMQDFRADFPEQKILRNNFWLDRFCSQKTVQMPPFSRQSQPGES